MDAALQSKRRLRAPHRVPSTASMLTLFLTPSPHLSLVCSGPPDRSLPIITLGQHLASSDVDGNALRDVTPGVVYERTSDDGFVGLGFERVPFFETEEEAQASA